MTLSSFDDQVQISIGGETFDILKSYDVAQSVFRQPGSFSCEIGHGRGRTIKELRDKVEPNSPFEMKIGHAGSGTVVPIMGGFTDGEGSQGARGATVRFSGSDLVGRLTRSYITAELSFPQKTHRDLLRTALDAVGLEDSLIFSDDVANQRAHAGVQVKPVLNPNIAKLLAEIEDPTDQQIALTAALGVAKKKTVHLTIKAQLGTTWYDFLQEHFRRVGLFIWADTSSGVVLSAPNPKQEPTYRLLRRRNEKFQPGGVNVLTHAFRNSITSRYTKATVYGRGGIRAGRAKVKGEFQDPGTAIFFGGDFDAQPLVIHDNTIKTSKEAERMARRKIANANRQGFKLEYKVSGHTTSHLQQGGARAVWTPNTIVNVEDEELGLSGDFYLHSCRYQRSPQTTTVLELARPEDIVFLPDEEFT